MNERIQIAQEDSRKAYLKFLKKFDQVNKQEGFRDIFIRCIITFFKVAEGKTPEELADLKQSQQVMSDEEIAKLCLDICGESVNRDFVSFISTGDRGNVGTLVYKSLN